MNFIERPIPQYEAEWRGTKHKDQIRIFQETAYDPIMQLYLEEGDDLVEVEWNRGVNFIDGGSGADIVSIMHYEKGAYRVKKIDDGFRLKGPELDLKLVNVELLQLNGKFFDLKTAAFDKNDYMITRPINIPKGTKFSKIGGTNDSDLVCVNTLYTGIRLDDGNDVLLMSEGLAYADFGSGEDTLELNGSAENYTIRKFNDAYLITGKNLQVHAFHLENIAFRGDELNSAVLDLSKAAFDEHGAVNQVRSAFEPFQPTLVLNGTAYNDVFKLGSGNTVIDAGLGIDVLELSTGVDFSIRMGPDGNLTVTTDNASAVLKNFEYLRVEYDDNCSQMLHISEDDFDCSGSNHQDFHI